MRATPLMLAIALGLGLPAADIGASDLPSLKGEVSQARENYIVVFEEAPVPSFRGFGPKDGRRPQLAATAIAVTGANRFDPRSEEAQAYAGYLADLRQARLNEAATRIGRDLQPLFVYEYALNGVALSLTASEAERLRTVPGVKRVQREFIRYPLTDRGPKWIKADAVWNGTATPLPYKGEGIVAGIIDSGINRTHVSFAATGPVDGYVHVRPARYASFLGRCASVPASCNNKLIGIYDFIDGGPLGTTADAADSTGHGTHTASTTAGNLITAGADTVGGQISGVAPRANIIAYKVCATNSCNGTAIVAAINQAIANQVDVINYSIGSGPSDPWAAVGGAVNDDSEAFLVAREAGIVVAAAAGNDGRFGPGTHGNPANSPWVLGVGAVTHDRAVLNRLSNLTGGDTPPPNGGLLVGSGNTTVPSSLTQRPIVIASDFPLCATGVNPDNSATGISTPATWNAGTRFSNQIVVCQRGFYARIAKSKNVANGCAANPGSCGMVMVNTAAEADSTVADPHSVPSVHLDAVSGAALMQWLQSGSGHQGRLEGTVFGFDPFFGDRLADFSGRGPVIPQGVLKPDVTAPGVSIIAAGIANNTGTMNMQGTSMATPHVAGAAALMKSTNPALTANQIISALILTARDTVTDAGEAAHPHERGAGTIDVSKAVRAGLFLDISGTDFRNGAANPQNMNLPSLAHPNCLRTCSLSRTFKLMPGVATGTYSISAVLPSGASLTPSSPTISLSGAASQAITFNFNVDAPQLAGRWVYGKVVLTNTSGDGRPDLVLPVALDSKAGVVPAPVVQGVPSERGFLEINAANMVAFPNARFVATRLAIPTTVTQTLAADPTNSDPFDAVTGTLRRTITVPASGPSGSVEYRIRALTSADAGTDIDLFIGYDENGDGLPSDDEILCASTTASASEVCEISVMSAGGARNYWAVAQNYSGAGTNTTFDSWLVALQAADDNTMAASGPGHVDSNAAFKVRVSYDEPQWLQGEKRLGYLLMQPTAGSTAAAVRIELTRNAATTAPYALANNVGRTLRLAAGGAQDKLYFDVPPHATSVTFGLNGTAATHLFVSRVAPPTSSTIAAAPPTGSAPFKDQTATVNKQIVVSGGSLLPGRYYVTPVNTGGSVATATVSAQITAVGTPPGLKSGHYNNPARDGHGMFVDYAGPIGNPDQWVVVWYTYLQDGTPTWYYAQAAAPAADAVWRADLLRVVWNGTAAAATDVGEISITQTGTNTLQASYNLDGESGSEPLVRVSDGSCPSYNAQAFDTTGHWYSPSKSGFGYSYQVTGGGSPQEVFIPYIYDGVGFPRWLYGQRAFDGGATALNLQWFSGFCPTCAHVGLTGTAAGTGSRSLATNNLTQMGVNATYTGALSGTWSEDLPVAMLSQRKNCQ